MTTAGSDDHGDHLDFIASFIELRGGLDAGTEIQNNHARVGKSRAAKPVDVHQ